MRRPLLLLPLFAAAAFAQDSVPPPDLNAVEKQFQEALNNVTLAGSYTVGDSSDLHDDRYVIERISKVKEDTWRFEARIQFNKRDVRIGLMLPVRFAGDTPVIALNNFVVPGFGAFSARIVIYDGSYAGYWSGGPTHKGIMFGKIVKNDTPAAQ